MSDQPDVGPERAVPSVDELEALFALGTAPCDGRPEYPGRDAAEHARRLLRRAVNPDRPGEEILRRLSRARAYDIERLPEPQGPFGSGGCCSIYEHAFLLDDDREACLYELEHDLTPDCQLVSEVYPDEVAARRRARVLGP
jgi:hypothetical protein